MANDIHIQSRELLSEEKYKLEKITYKAQGQQKPVSREVYSPPDAVTVLLYHSQQKTVLLMRQFRLAAFVNGHPTGKLLETCAGHIEKGEDPETTIIREIKEETGYAVQQVQKLFTIFSSPGLFTENLHYYTADYAGVKKEEKGGGLPDEQEDIKVLELPFEEAYNKVASGEIVDAKTVVLLQWAKLNLFDK